MKTKYINNALQKYGNSVVVCGDNYCISTKAFIQPLRRKYVTFRRHVNYVTDESPVDVFTDNNYNQGYLLYIGDVDCPLLSENTTVEFQNADYTVVASEDFVMNNESIYVWAILKPKEKNGE